MDTTYTDINTAFLHSDIEVLLENTRFDVATIVDAIMNDYDDAPELTDLGHEIWDYVAKAHDIEPIDAIATRLAMDIWGQSALSFAYLMRQTLAGLDIDVKTAHDKYIA